MVRQAHHQDLILMIKYLFWWVPEKELASLSHDAIVEAVLSNGNEDTVRQLLDHYGIEKVAEIFNRQTSGRRINYRPRTVHFFRQYFHRHAQDCSSNNVRNIDFDRIIHIPDLLTLAAMKAYALGGRAKWKDYVDLYILLRDHFSLGQISKKSKDIFGVYYNEKLFREQLCYFQDVDYSEKVDFVVQPVSDEEIKQFLTDVATTPFSTTRSP